MIKEAHDERDGMQNMAVHMMGCASDPGGDIGASYRLSWEWTDEDGRARLSSRRRDERDAGQILRPKGWGRMIRSKERSQPPNWEDFHTHHVSFDKSGQYRHSQSTSHLSSKNEIESK